MEIQDVVLIVTIVIVIIITVLVIVLWRFIFDNDQRYGNWEQQPPTECIMKGESCVDGGTQTVTEICNPTERGVGCLNDQGKQVYGTRTIIRDCQPVCQASVFELVDTSPCIIEGIPPTQCVLPGTTGTRTSTSECKVNETDGANMCTRVEIVPIIGPTGEAGIGDRLVVYQPGDTITETANCTDYVNPICGSWIFEELPPINTSICQANSTIFLRDMCTLGDMIPSISSTLIEGYITEDLQCSTGNTDTSTDSTPNCIDLLPPECSDVMVDPSSVAAGIFDPKFLGVQCSGINSSSTVPTCLGLCRKQISDPSVFSSVAGGSFNELLTALVYIQIPTRGYLNVEQSPPVDELSVVHRDTIPFATVNNNISPLQLIDLRATDGRDCADEERQFATSCLLRFAYRSQIDSHTVSCQIAITQSSDYVGWMIRDPVGSCTPKWIRMQTEYGAEGVLSKDVPEFNVVKTSPFIPEKLSGFPANMLGTMRISLKASDGTDLVVPLIDINRAGDEIIGSFTLNNVEAYLFPLDTNLSSRSDRSAGNCNLQFDPNGFVFQPLGEWEM